MACTKHEERFSVSVLFFLLNSEDSIFFMKSLMNMFFKMFAVGAGEMAQHLILLGLSNGLGSIPNTHMVAIYNSSGPSKAIVHRHTFHQIIHIHKIKIIHAKCKKM